MRLVVCLLVICSHCLGIELISKQEKLNDGLELNAVDTSHSGSVDQLLRVNQEDDTSVQEFLNELGKSLDYCNLKIADSAELARLFIRRFTDTFVANEDLDEPADEIDIANVLLDDMQFEDETSDYSKGFVADSEGSAKVKIWVSLRAMLDVIHEACDDLPIMIIQTDIDKQSHPERKKETALEEIIRALTRWTQKWTTKLGSFSNEFLDACVAVTDCERSLEIIINVFTAALEKTKNSNTSASQDMNIHSIVGSSLFSDHFNAETHILTIDDYGNKKTSSSYSSSLQARLEKMAAVISSFIGLSETNDEEYSQSLVLGDETLSEDINVLDDPEDINVLNHPEDTAQPGEDKADGDRMQRIIAAAVGVLRFPWEASDYQKKVEVAINSSALLWTVPPTFLSLALESKAIHESSRKFNTRSEKVRNMMSVLSPAVFRLGGSSANFLTFDPDQAAASHLNDFDNLVEKNSIYADLRYSDRLKRNSIDHPVAAKHPKYHTIQNKLNEVNKQREENIEPANHRVASHKHPKLKTIQKTVTSDEGALRQPQRDFKRISGNGFSVQRRLDHPMKTFNSPNLATNGQHQIIHRNIAPDEILRNPENQHSLNKRNIPVNHPKFLKRSNSLAEESRRKTSGCLSFPNLQNFTMEDENLAGLLDFCAALNWTLLFDLNQFYRTTDGAWDPSNARMIMRAVRDSGADVVWQVGNEPNNYAHHFSFSISGQGMAEDVRGLRRELHDEAGLWDRVKEDLGLGGQAGGRVVGPDVTRPRRWGLDQPDQQKTVGTDSVKFLEEFLLSAGPELVDAITWHQYYVCGRTATEEQFTSPDVLDLFLKQITAVRDVRDRLAPDTPIWITETGSAYGGGAPGLSNRFAGVFMWLDKLGVAAREGAQVVARQSLYGGNYAMLDDAYNPNPDYWVSVLHKLLVGGKVLSVQLSGAPSTLRLYAHCLKETSEHYQSGGVVLFGLNTDSASVEVSLQSTLTADDQLLQYLLTPALGDLTARDVLLNGSPLAVDEQGCLHPLVPKTVSVEDLVVPGYSAGFWLLPQMGAEACV